MISTNTWGLTAEMEGRARGAPRAAALDGHRAARPAVGREAIEQAGRPGEAALAFSINGDVDSDARKEMLELLPRVFEDDPPDLVLLETITLVRDGLTFGAIEALVQSGIPVWVSFRRCRHGVCGVFGQHWGGPEGDEFGRAARRFEDIGVRALLINCLPPDHVPGMLPWLRDFTDLPLGVYPNLGYYTADGWSFDQTVDGDEYAELAAHWRQEGPRSSAAAAARGPSTSPPRARACATCRPARGPPDAAEAAAAARWTPALRGAAPRPWIDDRGRRLFPLEMPEIVCEPGVFVPTQAAPGLEAPLPARASARASAASTSAAAPGCSRSSSRATAPSTCTRSTSTAARSPTRCPTRRNGVADRMTGEAIDLYPWVPKDRYDLVVASLYQMPVDPYDQPNTHRPLDFWGRNLLDHLITLLPKLLDDDGVAYVMQLSILGQARTAELLAEHGYESRVVDFAFFDFHELFQQRKRQIERVEELSDAYHLRFRDEDVMVAYLLEVTPA